MAPTARVVHNGFWQNPGGGERVARAIGSALDSPVSFGHAARDTDGVDDVICPGLHGGLTGRFPTIGDLKVAIEIRSRGFDEDVIVSTGTNAKWFYPRPEQTHVHYCHFPPAYAFRATRGAADWVVSTAISMIDSQYADYVDAFVANSAYTRRVTARYYDVDENTISVVHPPVDVESFWHSDPVDPPLFVFIGRLNEWKGADIVADAFAGLNARLAMVGTGPLADYCRSRGASVYEWLDDVWLRHLVARSTGGVAFAEEEHFGITPVEFHAAGKPVIVPDCPNLCNHVTDGLNGIVTERSASGLRHGVEEIVGFNEWRHEEIQRNARVAHAPGRFEAEIREVVGRAR